MNRISPVLAVGLAGLVLSACGAATPAATTELSVTGTDALAFDPEELVVPAGEQVTLTFTSEPSVEHDFVVEGVGMAGAAGDDGHGDMDDHAADDAHAMDADDLHVAHADPGETANATFTIEEAGTYTVYCSVPGHRQAGMETTLTVVDDA